MVFASITFDLFFPFLYIVIIEQALFCSWISEVIGIHFEHSRRLGLDLGYYYNQMHRY